MRKIDIVNMMACGVAEITSHCLAAEDAYRVYRFRRSLRKASDDISAAELEMLAEVGIADAAKFDGRLKELRASREYSAELAEMEAQLAKYNAMRNTMLEEDAPELFAPRLPYEQWKALQDENHTDRRDVLVGMVEEVLEGVVWIAPES